MAYCKRNYLLRIIEIQNITLEHQNKGATKRWIFSNIIKQKYYISEATYRKYLGVNAKRLIKHLEKRSDASKTKV